MGNKGQLFTRQLDSIKVGGQTIAMVKTQTQVPLVPGAYIYLAKPTAQVLLEGDPKVQQGNKYKYKVSTPR